MSINIEQFQQNLVYRTTASVRGLKNAIIQIVEFERFHEAEKNRSKKVALIGLIFIIFGSVIANSAGNVADLPIASFLVPFSVSLVILGIGTTFWGCKRWIYHSTFNLSQRRHRYELLQNLLEIWHKDIKFSRKLKLSLDLQKQDDKSKFQKQEPYLNRKDGKINFYRDEWLKVKGEFLDETKFFLQITERHQVRSWKNINNKHRVRPVPKGFEITLSLTCRPGQYLNLLDLEKWASSAIKLPATVKLKRLKVAGNKLTLKAKVSPNSNADALKKLLYKSIVLMFLSSYQILNLARAMNQQQGA